MVKVHKVAGYEEFCSFINDLTKNPKEVVNVYFTGSKDNSGKSWCPDCNDGKLFMSVKALQASRFKFCCS